MRTIKFLLSLLVIIGFLFCILSCSKHSSQETPLQDPLKSNKYDIVKIIAHRGFWRADSSKPSTNSLASLRFAQEYHLWGSEFDVQITADSIPIVFHDDKVEDLTIATNTLSSLSSFRLPNGEEIPTLDKFLSIAAEDKELVLVLEFKSQTSDEKNYLLIEKSLELLSKYNLLSSDRVVFISFSPIICKRLAQSLPGFKVQALFSNKSLEEVKEMGLNGIDYYYDILLSDPSIINKAHSLQLGVNTWTVNNLATMKTLISEGVDFITTDDPIALRSLMIEFSDQKN